MRLFFEGFEGCCLFGLCDAMLFALFLSRLAGNKIGAEGAGRLAEPLGKLTALLKLDLGGTVSGLVFFVEGFEGVVGWDCAMQCCLLCL